MIVLICTVFDIDIPCAGLHRLTKMSKSLESHGIQCLLMVGSGAIDMKGQPWMPWKENNQKYILFDKSLFAVKRHCNAMRIAATSAKFYRNYLSEIIYKLQASGVIVYSPQSQLISPLFEICKKNEVFILADCTENFSLSFRNLLNGVNYEQWKFRVSQMKKLDGAIVSSPRWFIDTNKSNIPASLIPGFLEPKKDFRSHKSVKSDKFNITIMGKFAGREKPSAIVKALKICKQEQLSFKLNIVGSGRGGRIEKYWLKKLTKDPIISNDVNIFGYVSNNERDKILVESDIFIMLRSSSKEIEYIYPSRVSEFLFSGNPVILTDTPALNLFFKQDFGVYFISRKNHPLELAQMIMALAKDPIARFESGRKGRSYALENFSLEVMGKELYDFIISVKKAKDANKNFLQH